MRHGPGIPGPSVVSDMSHRWLRREWAMFCRAWTFIGIAECMAHNLMCIAHSPSEKTREIAARDVAHTVTAGLWTLWQEHST